MQMKTAIAGVVVAIGLAIGGYALMGKGIPGQEVLPSATAQTTTATDQTATQAPAAEVKNFALGPADAKVQIVEYAMFTCPHCKHFHDESWARLKADYIDTGKVRFEFREVYFNRPALWAALVARCGGEMRYFGMVDMLFDKQQEWTAAEDPKAIVANLKSIGRAAGMEDAAMEACLQDQDTAKALVAHYEAQTKADGVEGTPTFFINGVKKPNMGYDELKAAIEAELAK